MSSSEDDVVKRAVLDYLATADMATTTERGVLQHVTSSLGLAQPSSHYKPIVGAAIEEFLSSLPAEDEAPGDEGAGGNEDEEGEEEPAPSVPAKRGRKAAAGGAAASKKARGSAGQEEELFVQEIGGRRKARLYVDVREFYDKDGAEAPGAKGLSMDPGQWASLARELPRLVGAQRERDASTPVVPLAKTKLASKDGALLPGKKGIALSPADWATLAAAVGDISDALARRDMAYILQLSGMRRVSLSEFKGQVYVGVREFYDKGGGELAPGQKGLSMNAAQWQACAAGAAGISAALEAAQG
ncbi:RNA polymerase II transcriptional coactivator [Tetrabaena socialis]|uniref:RNA polymerase II transcriptional coactivator n=1 Tax=Tetrabaena socialis TaxID=47790 RepID=A0A2J8AIE8_9CHLO|nr:RNA polymerase II transcriptional coactivator [Tetrabaena socialis]|eukprot:PNH12288.1 RNA polymerase II transcriptional coactivator [Tetrabaena socialis]